VDNLHTTLRHVGRCIVDMVPRVYDTQRVVRTMNDDKSVSTAEVNVPIPPHEQDADSGEVKNDLTVGEYDITIGVGPSYDTMRQEALDGMIELGGRWPKLMDVAGDKVVRAMDWPGAEEIAERLAKTLPPGLRDPEETEGEEQINTPQGPIPKSQVGSAMAQMQGQMQQMQQQWEAMQPELAKERIMADSRIRVAEISAAAKQDVEELKGFVQLLVAQNQQMKDAIAAMQQEALGRQDKPGSQEPPAARADETSALLAGIIQRMGGSKKRRMTIQAPSGASYVGEMQDVGDNNEDPGGMPPDQQPQPPAQG
jgi:DNA-binding protein YbaB